MSEATILSRLFSLQDIAYRDFQAKLIPTVPSDTVIGVRLPALRALAKELTGKNAVLPEDTRAFLSNLPHHYYEENTLHGLIIERFSDYTSTVSALDRFLPFVDNWATCDSIRPKVFKKNLDKLDLQAVKWLSSEYPYMVRFGIEMLMTFYLDDHFDKKYPAVVASVESDEYYIRMMVAWYFATALAKQYDNVLPYLEQHLLSPWVHNKTIQKAVESYRITPKQKQYLKTLKIRG
ncbi:MAG: DNA alkylation repair protein [Ruminococcaceae bacterium]|nr:DNA alkylation repair protein [Oscillospiraceae bacterium]